VVTNAWPRDDDPGYGIFIKRQVESLRELGVRFDVMFVRGYLSKRAYGFAAAALAELSRSESAPYRLVHAHGGETAFAAAAYRRAPVLVSYLGLDILGSRTGDGRAHFRSRARAGVLRESARFVSRTITKSREMHNALPRSCRRRNDVVPSGVDPSTFTPMPRDDARRLLGWHTDAPIALFGANPKVSGKRYWLAAAACEVASRQLENLELKTLGGIKPSVVPLMMNAADCLLFTSSAEGSPNVVKEALMCNLPVVATPAGDVRDLLERISPSWVCVPSADALGDAVAKALSGPVRSDGRAKSAHLTTASIADRVLAIYKGMLSQEADSAESSAEHALR
jgi:teichuronic acid biosynthesis glycosyltransferase TuaC